jgi:putative ABC transport system permease protein
VTDYLLLFFATSLLAGFYPAFVLSGFNPVQTLYGRLILSRKNYLQKSLVVLQFTLATFLIVATFTTFSQFHYLTTIKLGYDDSSLVLVPKPGLTRGEARLLKADLMKSPDITGIASKDEGFSFNRVTVNGDSAFGFANMTIDESYLPLLKIPVIKGRNFSPDHPSDSSRSVIVNEAFVKKAGWGDPIGQQVRFDDSTKYAVIGVVKDYHFQALSQAIAPELFSMRMQNDLGMSYIKIRPGSETRSLQYIEKTFKSSFPLNSFVYTFKDEENRKNYQEEAKWKQIILFGTVLTIFISCIGLFGLSVSSAEKRRKEIGIRKVLGASVGAVVATLSTDFLKLALLAMVISMPLAWFAANKWLEHYPYRIKAGWELFAVTGLLVGVIALATVSFQAIKTAMVNPVRSLRAD